MAAGRVVGEPCERSFAMAENKVLAEGSPSKAVALAVATVGFVIFAGISAAGFVAAALSPGKAGTGFWIAGGLTALLNDSGVLRVLPAPAALRSSSPRRTSPRTSAAPL